MIFFFFLLHCSYLHLLAFLLLLPSLGLSVCDPHKVIYSTSFLRLYLLLFVCTYFSALMHCGDLVIHRHSQLYIHGHAKLS